MTPQRGWKDKNPIGILIHDEVEGKKLTPSQCPMCHSFNTDVRHHQGNSLVPETTYKWCEDCDHQWDHQ